MKKIASLLLAVVMVFSMMPMTTFAAETDMTISFETTFNNSMTVDDTFTVTAKLANNPGIYSVILNLLWNDKVVRFDGFETEYDEDAEADVLKSDVLATAIPGVWNNGMITGTRTATNNTKKVGTLFTAKFTVIAGGDLGIALDTSDPTVFEFSNIDTEDVPVFIDDSNISGLTASGEAAAPDIPEELVELGVLEITTDAGNVIVYEEQDWFNGVPYYIITIPEDAQYVYVTDSEQYLLEDYRFNNELRGQAYIFHDEYEAYDYTQQYVSFAQEEVTVNGTTAPKLEIPMTAEFSGMSGDTFVANMVENEDGYTQSIYANEHSDYSYTYALSFRYAKNSGTTEPDPEPVCDHANAKDDGNCTTAVTCPDCSVLIKAAEPGHDYAGQAWLTNETGHWMKCKNCDVTTAETAHDFGDDDTCDTCKYARDHVHQLTKVEAKEATCHTKNEKGYIEHYTCSAAGCAGKYFNAEGTELPAADVEIATVDCVYVNDACKWCGTIDPASVPYAIYIDENIVGGTIRAINEAGEEITEAKTGDVVILEVTPAEGYKNETFGYIFNGTTYHAENGAFNMPAGEVTLTATFASIYNSITKIEKLEVGGAELAGSDGSYTMNMLTGGIVTLNVATDGNNPNQTVVWTADKEGIVEINGNTIKAIGNGTVTLTATVASKARGVGDTLATLTITVTAPEGYTYAISKDQTLGTDGTEATITVSVTDGENNTFNAYDITLSYNPAELTVKMDENGKPVVTLPEGDTGDVVVDATNGTIHIAGVGDPKNVGATFATITFTEVKEGSAEVTVTEAKVSNDATSVNFSAPPATANGGDDETPNSTVINKVFKITKPNFVVSENTAGTVAPGGEYTFCFDDVNNYKYGEVTIIGTATLVNNQDGTYTIKDVQSNIIISVERTANSYKVQSPDENEVEFVGGENATYDQAYEFTVTPKDENYKIGRVTVTIGNGEPTVITPDANGKYVIDGKVITGEIQIAVVLTNKGTVINFTNITASEIQGGMLSVEVESGKAYTFTLIPEQFYSYTAKVGDAELQKDGNTYTVPANLINAGTVTVEITKTVDKTQFTVEVQNYFNGNKQTMWLITAKAGDHVMTYGENTMYYSSKYEAYCWLLPSAENQDAVKAAAIEALNLAAANTAYKTVEYNCDVNNTDGDVDINDAQLAYDMYNAKYFSFDEDNGGVDMLKFLEADVANDKKLDTLDVTAIIGKILNPNAEG